MSFLQSGSQAAFSVQVICTAAKHFKPAASRSSPSTWKSFLQRPPKDPVLELLRQIHSKPLLVSVLHPSRHPKGQSAFIIPIKVAKSLAPQISLSAEMWEMLTHHVKTMRGILYLLLLYFLCFLVCHKRLPQSAGVNTVGSFSNRRGLSSGFAE